MGRHRAHVDHRYQPLTCPVLSSQCWARPMSPSMVMPVLPPPSRGNRRVKVSNSDAAGPLTVTSACRATGCQVAPSGSRSTNQAAPSPSVASHCRGLSGAADGVGRRGSLHRPGRRGEHREMVADERGRDVGGDFGELTGRVGCVETVDDRLVQHAGQPELRPVPRVACGVEHGRVQRVIGAGVRDSLRGFRQPGDPVAGVDGERDQLGRKLRRVGDAPLDDLGDPVLGLPDVPHQVGDGPLRSGRHHGIRSGQRG